MYVVGQALHAPENNSTPATPPRTRLLKSRCKEGDSCIILHEHSALIGKCGCFSPARGELFRIGDQAAVGRALFGRPQVIDLCPHSQEITPCQHHVRSNVPTF